MIILIAFPSICIMLYVILISALCVLFIHISTPPYLFQVIREPVLTRFYLLLCLCVLMYRLRYNVCAR